MFLRSCHSMFAVTFLLTIASIAIGQDSTRVTYDPLRTSIALAVRTFDTEIKIPKDEREVPIRIYYLEKSNSSDNEKSPIILFSHGLGGSRNGSPHIGEHWAKRGYTAVFLQHPGSDASVWKDASMRERMKAMNNAASAENFLKRNLDVKVVIDQWIAWQEQPDTAPTEIQSILAFTDLSRLGMSGHSFGAVTTQAVSGQSFPLGRNFTDARIKAAVIMSPSSPKVGNVQTAFGKVSIPWLLMTGTKDTSPIGNADVESRLAVYPALPEGNKYELVLFNAEHSFPGERSLPGEKEKRNPNHSRAVLALSTAFWDSHLKKDPQATEWLNGSGPRSILEKSDTWKHK